MREERVRFFFSRKSEIFECPWVTKTQSMGWGDSNDICDATM